MQKILIDYITEMERASAFDDKWQCLVGTLNALGFNVVNYTVFSDLVTYKSPAFIENFRNNWIEYYIGQGYGEEDALIPHVLNSDRPAIMLSADEKQPLAWSKKGLDLIADAKEAGMERAIGFSHKNSDGKVDGGVAIGSDMMSSREFQDFISQHVTLLHTIYSIAYQNLHPECHQRISRAALNITPRQYDLVMALWDGLANKQIADRLGVSEVTVSFHLRELRQKLGARLNREIIPRAYYFGILGSLPNFRQNLML